MSKKKPWHGVPHPKKVELSQKAKDELKGAWKVEYKPSPMTLRQAAKLGSLWSESKTTNEETEMPHDNKDYTPLDNKGMFRVLKALKKHSKNPSKIETGGELGSKEHIKFKKNGKMVTKTNEETEMPNTEETEMSIQEMKYGATHEFHGNKAFMEKHAEHILKKHHIQIHSVETLPEENMLIFHVSGSAKAITDASSALYDEANGKTTPPVPRPSKFGGFNKKIVSEETEMNETEITQDELLGEGPAALLDAIVNEDEDTPELFNAVMGAKIDVMLDMMKNELAAGMFQTEPAVATEDFIAALGEAGVELTEEQLDELSKEKLGRYLNAASDDKANLAFDKGKEVGASNKKPVGHGAVYSAKETKRSRGIATAVRKLTKEDAAEIISTLGIELTEEQADMLEASLWRPQEAGFTKKGVAPKKGLKKNFGEYDRKAHERINSTKMLDQMKTKGK